MNPTYDLCGRVEFVTGAGSGMGLATARAFAEAGAAVTLTNVADQALHTAGSTSSLFDWVFSARHGERGRQR